MKELILFLIPYFKISSDIPFDYIISGKVKSMDTIFFLLAINRIKSSYLRSFVEELEEIARQLNINLYD